jgi:phage baseplate assembly protein W
MAQAKSYSFSSVGTKKSTYDAITAATVVTPPVGIKTPLEMGDDSDGIFKMHRSLGDQIKDNFVNLILTNHNERLNFPDYGANIRPLLHELSAENGDEEAMKRIQRAVSKYLPFVILENFITTPQDAGTTALAKIKMVITYSVPRANLTNQSIGIVFNFSG